MIIAWILHEIKSIKITPQQEEDNAWHLHAVVKEDMHKCLEGQWLIVYNMNQY